MRAASSFTGSAAGADKVTAAFAAPALRLGFLRKVYGILTAQVAFTVVVAAASMYVPTLNRVLVSSALSESWFLRLGLLLPTVLSLLFLQLGAKNQYPANYIWLSILTCGIALNVGYVCAVFQAMGAGIIILEALVATLLIFGVLTAFVLISDRDFSYVGGFLGACLLVLAATGFLGLFFPSLVDNFLYICLGVITFCAYMLYDTWRIAKVVSVDDYILATVELYLDFINLFFYLVRLLKKLSDDDKSKRRR